MQRCGPWSTWKNVGLTCDAEYSTTVTLLPSGSAKLAFTAEGGATRPLPAFRINDGIPQTGEHRQQRTLMSMHCPPDGAGCCGTPTNRYSVGNCSWKSRVSKRCQWSFSSTNRPMTELSVSKNFTSPSAAQARRNLWQGCAFGNKLAAELIGQQPY